MSTERVTYVEIVGYIPSGFIQFVQKLSYKKYYGFFVCFKVTDIFLSLRFDHQPIFVCPFLHFKGNNDFFLFRKIGRIFFVVPFTPRLRMHNPSFGSLVSHFFLGPRSFEDAVTLICGLILFLSCFTDQFQN